MINAKEEIRSMLKKEYPGCKTYIRSEYKHSLTVRVIHPSFERPFSSIVQVLEKIQGLKNYDKFPIIRVEPVTPEIWATRRY